jgi:DNA-binding response OmpR family regulator
MSAPGASRSHRATVLIVDDELPIADIVAEVLSEEGYATVIASGGEHALQILSDSRADLMLLDLYMPGLSGIDVLHQLRSRGHLDAMPVVVMTAGTVNLADLSQHGATGVLPKPFEVDALLDTVRSLV